MNSNTIVVTINGEKFSVDGGSLLSFRDVADLAKVSGVPSMTVRVKGGDGRIVHPGESVNPADGMVFNVYDTSNA